MSAVTCTSSPLLAKVTVPVTSLPDFDCRFATAFVTSCPCAKVIKPPTAIKEIKNVLMPERYGASGQNETLNQAAAGRVRRKHRPVGRAKTASVFYVRLLASSPPWP